MLDIMTLPVTAFAQNCRLLVDNDKRECVICDVGGSAREIYNLIESQDLRLKAILLTHGHLDHVGGAKELSDLTHVPIIGPHKDDLFLFESLSYQAQAFGLPDCQSFVPEFVKDGQILSLLDNVTFEIIHTPGHTPGGVCFYCKEENFLLSGDTLFAQSIGRADFERSDGYALIQSIKERLMQLPDNVDVMPGHGPDTTIAFEREHNPFIQD